MKAAITGAPSTGKTELAKRIIEQKKFINLSHLNVNARRLLDGMG